MDKAHSKTTRAQDHHWLWRDITLYEQRFKLTNRGSIQQRSISTKHAKLRTSGQTKLPFDTLTNAAREADVLPGLKRPLLSVNKMSEDGYTAIFHPGEERVTIHKEGTITITTCEPPVLKGRKSKAAKLWTISAMDKPENKR
jgi:hypothetical protein